MNNQSRSESGIARSQKFFMKMSKKTIEGLYKVFADDFEMFGFPYPKEYIEMGT